MSRMVPFFLFRTTVSAVDSFLDSFQRVADVANSSHGKNMCKSTSIDTLLARQFILFTLRTVFVRRKSFFKSENIFLCTLLQATVV